MIVELKLKDKNVIKWKYIDNPFTRKHMKVMQDAANSGTGWNDLWYELPQWMQPNYNKDLIQEQLDIIIDAINSINRVPDAKRGERIKFPIEVKDIKWLPRKHLENHPKFSRGFMGNARLCKVVCQVDSAQRSYPESTVPG